MDVGSEEKVGLCGGVREERHGQSRSKSGPFLTREGRVLIPAAGNGRGRDSRTALVPLLPRNRSD